MNALYPEMSANKRYRSPAVEVARVVSAMGKGHRTPPGQRLCEAMWDRTANSGLFTGHSCGFR
jgi:hypothetical protein